MAEFFTPAQIASRLGLSKPDPVFRWIATGELKALNVATNKSGRPTWRIRPDDFQHFLDGRTAVPAPVRPTRRGQRRPEVTAYF